MKALLKGRSTATLLSTMLCLQLGLVPLAMAAQGSAPAEGLSHAIAMEAIAL